MGTKRITLCVGSLAVAAATAAAATVLAVASTAYAAEGGDVWVSPTSPAPGGDVALRMSGCQEKTATAVSVAFVSDVRLAVIDGVLVGESRVRSSLTAGTYDVKVNCGGTARTIPLRVADAPTTPSAPVTPVAPVHAGGGGTAQLAAADARPDGADGKDGPGTGHAVTGMVLAGVAGVAVVLLGSRRSRRTG